MRILQQRNNSRNTISCRNWASIGAFILALLWTIPVFAGSAPNDGKDFVRSYAWDYNSESFAFSYRIPWETYNYYQERPRTYRNYAVYSYESKDHPFIEGFAKALRLVAEDHELNGWESIGMIAAFVQHLGYVRESGEYPKFPVETLADKGGDCEDSAILLATLYDRMGYDVLLVNPPGHMAVALACKNCEGPAYEKDGRKYYYIETTGSGFKVGEIPKEYRETKDKLFRLSAAQEELWVFAADPSLQKKGDASYYVSETDDSGVLLAGETRILTTTIVRTVTVNGKTYTTTTVIRKIE